MNSRHPIAPVDAQLIYHGESDPEGRGSIQVGVGSIVSGAELRDKLRPLSFAAAYKTLDMLVEHALRAKGLRLIA